MRRLIEKAARFGIVASTALAICSSAFAEDGSWRLAFVNSEETLTLSDADSLEEKGWETIERNFIGDAFDEEIEESEDDEDYADEDRYRDDEDEDESERIFKLAYRDSEALALCEFGEIVQIKSSSAGAKIPEDASDAGIYVGQDEQEAVETYFRLGGTRSGRIFGTTVTGGTAEEYVFYRLYVDDRAYLFGIRNEKVSFVAGIVDD